MKSGRSVEIRGKTFQVVYLRDSDFFDEHWRCLESGIEEGSTFAVFEEFIDDSTVVLDVGAWIGTTCLYASRLAKYVYAFEADPVAVESLRANLAANPSISNVQIQPKAVATTQGSIRIYSDASGNNSASSVLKVHGKTSWEVESVNLDQFVGEHCNSGQLFINMDIEGAEYEVIPALRFFGGTQKINMVLSIHPHLISGLIAGNRLIDKVRRRWLVVTKTWRMLGILSRFPVVLDSRLQPTSRLRIVLSLAVNGHVGDRFKEIFLLDRVPSVDCRKAAAT